MLAGIEGGEHPRQSFSQMLVLHTVQRAAVAFSIRNSFVQLYERKDDAPVPVIDCFRLVYNSGGPTQAITPLGKWII